MRNEQQALKEEGVIRWQGRSDLWKAIGPGILVACAAIGGSHLVWSTRAGADYGWSLVGLVLLANVLKLPFFLYGQRYAAATGESLLAGYRRMGVGYVYLFLGINILTGIINIAAVAMLSGSLFTGYFGGVEGVAGYAGHFAAGIMAVCALLLLLGHYRLLDGMAKWVVVVLTISTVVAVGLAFSNPVEVVIGFEAESPWKLASFGFIIVLLGWMPAPVDLSAWSSLWMFSREKQTGHFATVRETSIDFYLGYIMATVMAVLFLALGALVMFGSGNTFSESGGAFSHELVGLYASTIGEWSRPLILTAAFVTMFSTTLTCVDGYPRSLAACCVLIWGGEVERFHLIQRLWIILSVVVASLIIYFLVGNLLQLMTFAAVVAFMTSPVLAYINYKVMTGGNVPEEARPGGLLRVLSWSGLIFFIVLALGYGSYLVYGLYQSLRG